jgi:hypothetical protein
MTMSWDLDTIFSALTAELPTSLGDMFMFTPKIVPSMPPTISTRGIILKHRRHNYDDVSVDRVELYAEHATLRLLGLAFISRLFHPTPDKVTLQVAAAETDIEEVVLDATSVGHGHGYLVGYTQQVTSFEYLYAPTERWPLSGSRPELWPAFFLTSGEFGPTSQEEHLNPNRVRIAGGAPVFADLAQIFLNVGHPASDVFEVDFESALGNGGVTAGSAELKLWLPGSEGWDPSLLP